MMDTPDKEPRRIFILKLAAAILTALAIFVVTPIYLLSWGYYHENAPGPFISLALAMEAGIEESEALGLPLPPAGALCRQPLTAVPRSDRGPGIRTAYLRPPASDTAASYTSCIHPVVTTRGCAHWRFENCLAFAFHRFVLEEPVVMQHVIRALEEPCAYLNHPQRAALGRNFNGRFHDVQHPYRGGAGQEQCAAYARRTYVINILDDDRRRVMTLRMPKA
jgi:hypothetical protein